MRYSSLKPALFLFVVLTTFSFSANVYRYCRPGNGTGNIAQGTTRATAFNLDTAILYMNSAMPTTTDTFTLVFYGGSYGGNGVAHIQLASQSRTATAATVYRLIGVNGGATNEGANIVASDYALDPDSFPDLQLTGEFQRVAGWVIAENLYIHATVENGMLLFENTFLLRHCKIVNNGVSSGNHPVIWSYGGNGGFIIDCYVRANSNQGIQNQWGVVERCWVRDSGGSAIAVTGNNTSIRGNIIQGCKYGVYLDNNLRTDISKNLFIQCDTAIFGSSGGATVVDGNIFDTSCTGGIVWSSLNKSIYVFENHIDTARFTANEHNIFVNIPRWGLFSDWKLTVGDPQFTDRSAHNFQFTTASPAADTASKLITNWW